MRVIQANDFIRATTQGVLDREENKKVLTAIASAAESLADFGILLDVRKAQPSLSTTDLWYLAADLANQGITFRHKVAVLCPPEGFDDGKFFALCAQNRGLDVSGFLSFEQAITWLIETPDLQGSPGQAATA